MTILLIKIGICVALTLALLLALRFKKDFIQWSNGRESLAFWILFLLFRLLPFLIIYVLLGIQARSDVPMFYEAAKSARALLFVYRDFESAYSPLFAYLTAIPTLFWDSPNAIVLFMMMIEGIILWFTYRFYYSSEVLFNVLLYLLLPASFVLSVLGGQEDIWMWGFVVWVMWANRQKNNELWTGIILGIGLVVTKALFVLILPAVFFFVKDKVRFVLGLLLVGIPTLVVMYWHSDLLFLSPIQQANDPRTPNLWTILHPLTNGLIPLGPKFLNWIGLISILFLSIFAAVRLRKSTNFNTFLPVLFVSIYVWLMVIQQSSLANYAYIYLMPLLFIWKESRDLKFWTILFLFNWAVVIQPPIWWGMNMPYFHQIRDLMPPMHLIEYLLELLIVGCLLWFLKALYRMNLKVGK